MNPIITLAKLYLPGASTVLLLFAAVFVKRGEESAQLHVKPFGLRLIEVNLPLSNVAAIRGVLIFLSTLPMLFLSFCDFSSLYPEYLDMEVFFDRDGIEQSLDVFTPVEREQLGIAQGYYDYQEAYYRRLDKAVEGYIGTSFLFGGHQDYIHSMGETSFVVGEADGFQRYYIAESKGRLVHTLDVPMVSPQSFVSFFEKRNSRADYLEPPLWRILLWQGYIMKPLFKQIIAENVKSDGTVFHHAVVGATKVWVYPYPRYSNTVYLADFGSIGFVPIGYAVYK